jgi:N-acetylglucosaminyl-diphospho-decaprenol L-rhamnosyltransferase
VIADVVVVSYNSRDHLHACVAPLAALADVHVIVADNASPDASLEAIAGLPVTALPVERNGGFSYGCNRGWRAGSAPYVLFLNPDARIDEASLRRLARVVETEPSVGIVAPRIVHEDGTIARSQRRFPRATTNFARALFLNRLFGSASWTSELVQEESAYEESGSPDWVSGACLMIRRSLLEELDGLDEGFFLYCEDKDLCLRARRAGYDVRFEPGATALHHEGASAPRPALAGALAASRLRYARKHGGPARAAVERVGLVLLALTHLVISRGGLAGRSGHLSTLQVAFGRRLAR